jgi:hydroxymethylglutaryl-CoA lyase
MNLPKKIKIREVAPRDGFQSWPEFVPTNRKLEIIQAMIKAGVTDIEATSFVNPKAIPQMRDATEVIKGVPRECCNYCAMVPNLRGAQMALEAGSDEIGVFISASEPHNMANVRRNIDDSMADLNTIFSLAKEKNIPVIGAVAVAFGCPYQGDVPVDAVFRLAEAYLSRGASAVILADTTGMATPPRIQGLVQAYKERFPDTRFGLHLHNNRGTAMTNLYAALEAGVTMFDTALGGIGGCPNVPQAAGNLPTEDVVYMLEDMGMDTGIDLVDIIEAAHLLEKTLGQILPGQVMKSGPRDPEIASKICNVGHDL